MITEQESNQQQVATAVSKEVIEVPDNLSTAKTYMDYKCITSRSSAQYQLLHSGKVEYSDDGLIRYDGYIGIAVGSYFGLNIGDKFTLQFEDGREVKVFLCDQKADKDVSNGLYHSDMSFIEVVIDTAKARQSYSTAIKMGDFNYCDLLNGKVISVTKE